MHRVHENSSWFYLLKHLLGRTIPQHPAQKAGTLGTTSALRDKAFVTPVSMRICIHCPATSEGYCLVCTLIDGDA